MVRLPQVLWAQQSDRLFLTIDLQDSKDPQIKLNNDSEKKCGTVFFDGAAKSTATGPELHEYKLDLELFGEVDPDESKISRKDRSVVLVIAKKEQGHWDRLLKTSARMPNIKVDWDKWVDEDEEETKPEFDMSSLGNLQDFSKYGADGGEDSDDEEIPPLEEDMDESKPAA